jgi:hypothetical protein
MRNHRQERRRERSLEGKHGDPRAHRGHCRSGARKKISVSRFNPASRLNPLLQDFRRLNILSTFHELAQERDAPEPRKRAA